LIAETDYPLHFGWAPLRAVRSEGFKFIEAPRPELYNLTADPGESNSKYEPWDSTVQKARKMLADVRAHTPASEASAASVGTGTLDELKALGYLGPADAGSATNVPEPSLLPDPKDKIEEQNHLHAAMMAAEDGRTADARKDLEAVVTLNPNSQTALVQMGVLELHDGNYQKAAEHLKRARELRPQDATIALYQGEALQKLGDFSGARYALEASLKLNPKSGDARILLGQTYLAEKNSKAAKDQFEAALLVEPNRPEAHIGLAKTAIADGNFGEAVDELLPFARTANADAEIFELLAVAYSKIGKNVEAQRARVQATELKKTQAAKGRRGPSSGSPH
jgi:Flp pilus assembly protein TadD